MPIIIPLPNPAPAPAKLTFLAMVQQACGELGLVQPTSVIGNSDQQVIQLLALAKRESIETQQMSTRDYGWQALRREFVFNVQSTGLLTVSYTAGSNLITITNTGSFTSPQIGWLISNSGGSNSTDFPYPTRVVAVISPTQFQVDHNAANTNDNSQMAVGLDAYDIPGDADKLIPGTMWDRSYRWQILGPLTPAQWQVLLSGLQPAGPRRRYRIMDNKFVINPIPYDSNQLVYEYYSNQWCQSAQGVLQSTWLADSDTYLLDDNTFILGLIWRFRRSKGLDYDQEWQNWNNSIDRYKSNQATSSNIAINSQDPGFRLLQPDNVPDTGFGVP